MHVNVTVGVAEKSYMLISFWWKKAEHAYTYVRDFGEISRSLHFILLYFPDRSTNMWNRNGLKVARNVRKSPKTGSELGKSV